jgi:protein tyrosine/serine phosphatase
MEKINHSKFKNTGLIFELLTRQIAADALNNSNSKALNLINKHFHNKSELLKEQKLYSILVNSRLKSETKANILINSILENAKKINKSILKKEKYNLIKEIKFNYNIEDFFKTKINNYNNFASIYTLFESLHLDNINPIQITNNRYNLLENIVKKDSYIDKEDNIFEEYNKYDKGTRLLIYKLLIDDGPTFVHCVEGKDRTGMLIAMFKCKYMGYSYKQALKDASPSYKALEEMKRNPKSEKIEEPKIETLKIETPLEKEKPKRKSNKKVVENITLKLLFNKKV